MPREWDAASYDRVSTPLAKMGETVLDRLPLAGDEFVLDAGCGTGRVTAALLDRLDQGRVLAVDGSAAMIDQARARLGERAEYRVCDLLDLELDAPVDAILSTATFHWILDHQRLFTRLRATLRPGGRLVAQCGGAGNLADFYATLSEVTADLRFRRAFDGWAFPKRFAGPRETEACLRRAGFSDARCWLENVTVELDAVEEYLRTVLLGAHLDRLDARDREPFTTAVAVRAARPLKLAYVRLNIAATA